MRCFYIYPFLTIFVSLLLLQSGEVVAQDGAGDIQVQADTAEVNGIEIYYRKVGSGPPVLLLHGFTGTGSWWDSLLDDLSEEQTLIIPDLPKHGRSTGRPGQYLYSDVSTDLFVLLDHLDIDRFKAIGYSAGGIILLHMATQEPHRIRAMSLVSAAHVLTEPNRERLKNWPSFEEWPEETQEYWLELHPGGKDQVETLLKALRQMAIEGNNMDFTPEELSRIEAHTLLIIGDRDDLVPMKLGLEMYQAIPNAAFWVVPGQGHSPVWPERGGSQEAREIFPDLVQEFLGQLEEDHDS